MCYSSQVFVRVEFALACAVIAGCTQPSANKPTEPAPQHMTTAVLQTIVNNEYRRTDVAGVVQKSLTHVNGDVRQRAALAAGRMGLTTAAPQLLKLLHDTQPAVRQHAVFALRLFALDTAGLRLAGQLFDQLLPEKLVARLRVEHDASVRLELLRSLGWVGNADVVSDLQKFIGTNATAESEIATQALALLAYRHVALPAVLPELTAQLNASPTTQRFAAAWGLARAATSLSPAQRDAIKSRVTNESSADVKMWMTRAISDSALIEDVPLLQLLFADWTPSVQVEAARGLARAKVAGLVKLLQGLQQLWGQVSASHMRLTSLRMHPILVGLDVLVPHASTSVVNQFAETLFDASDAANLTTPLLPAEAHSFDLVHCAAAKLRDLWLKRPEYTPTCGSARSKMLSEAQRRAFVVSVLAQIPRHDEWQLSMLRRYLVDPYPSVRTAAAEALARIDSPAVSAALRKVIRDADPAVIGATARAISESAEHVDSDGPTIHMAAHRLADLDVVAEPEVACSIVEALTAVRFTAAVPLLRQLRLSPSWAVRSCVYTALTTLSKDPVDVVFPFPRTIPSSLTATDVTQIPKRAVIATHRGNIEIALLSEEAPATVANFVRLASTGFYKGTNFHRVVANFVAQGGDPRGDGWGGPGHTIPCELTPRAYERGSIGMALAGRDTGGSQFFITMGRQPHLDGRYTQFARVTAGMDIVDRLLPADAIKDVYVIK